MEILVFISVATTFFFVGWTIGRSTVVSEDNSRIKAEEHFKNGYRIINTTANSRRW